MSINKVILVGNVGKQPEVRRTEGGAAVANFTLATSEKYKDKAGNLQEQTEWHNIVCWRSLAEIVEKYVAKGSQLYIEGKIRTREWEKEGAKHYRTEIMADTIQMLGKKPDNSQTPQPAQSGNREEQIFPERVSEQSNPDDGDLPFN